MPRIARNAGRKIGRFVGAVVNMQARIASVAEGAGLSEVQRDLTEGFTQLHAIRDEIRTGVRPLAPGCARARLCAPCHSADTRAATQAAGAARDAAGA